VFTSALALMADLGVKPAIVSQIFIIMLSIFDGTLGTLLNSLHWIIINIAVLILLVINDGMN
jgi:hypothetical protein